MTHDNFSTEVARRTALEQSLRNRAENRKVSEDQIVEAEFTEIEDIPLVTHEVLKP